VPGARAAAASDAKARQPDLARCRVDQDVGGIDVPVNEAAIVQTAQRRRKGLGKTQEPGQRHRRFEKGLKRHRIVIVEHQHGSVVLAQQFQRPNRSGSVEMFFQAVFVCETVETDGRRICGRRGNNQERALVFVT